MYAMHFSEVHRQCLQSLRDANSSSTRSGAFDALTAVRMPTAASHAHFPLLTLCLLYSYVQQRLPTTKRARGASAGSCAVNGQEISTKLYEMYLKNGKEGAGPGSKY